MTSQTQRQIMIENFQDSLRMIRHLMNFGVEEFADAIGTTRQTINNLETKKTKLSSTQYVAIAALTDIYFSQNEKMLPALKAILDGDGKNYGEEYETAFYDDSLVKKWFENFIEEDFGENFAEREITLSELAENYKIFLDPNILKAEDTEKFIETLTDAMKNFDNKIIVARRSIDNLSNDVLKILEKMQRENVLQIRGDDTDPNFCDTIISVFVRFRTKYNLCLITSDKNFAEEVIRLNNYPKNKFNIAAGYIEKGNLKFYSDRIYFKDDSDPKVFEDEEKFETNDFNEAETNIEGWAEV